MLQSQEYWENGKMTYSAKSTIQEIDGEIVLISIIKDSAPKIFQATSRSIDEIIFENKDYTNPNQVIYQFSADRFTRTINGTENDQPVSYTFEFSSDIP